jgi:hypothetical protein
LTSLQILITRSEKTLTLAESSEGRLSFLLKAPILAGCEDGGVARGSYACGKWLQDKPDTVAGAAPWSQDPWTHPYGPFLLPLHEAASGRYSRFAIHGSRGPVFGGPRKPPLPPGLAGFFLEPQPSRYLFCSPGSFRLANNHLAQLFELTTQARFVRAPMSVTVK